MKNAIAVGALGLLIAACQARDPRIDQPVNRTATPPYPATPRDDTVVDTLHGVPVPDPYRALEDLDDPATRAWVDAQSAHAHDVLASLPGRDALARRFAELLYVDAISLPVRRGGRLFYTRRHKDREKSIVYWRAGDDGPEHVLLDPNTMSDDGSVSLGGWYPSWDGRLVAYNVKANNADEATMYVRDVATGKDLPDVLPGTKYAGAAWTPDGRAFVYTFLPSGPDISVADRPGYAEIRRHTLGDDPATDPVLFPHTGSARTFLAADLSEDGRWLFAYIQHGWNATDVWFRDLSADAASAAPAAPVDPAPAYPVPAGFVPLRVGADANYSVEVHDGLFYVLTNEDAPRYRVMVVDPARPARDAWREIVPESDATIESRQIVGGHLVLQLLERASSRLEVRDLGGALVREVPLPDIGSIAGVTGNQGEDDAYFSFSSFTHPPEIHRTSIATGATSLWAKVDLPLDPSPYAVDQVTYRSWDGTPVTMFVVAKKGLERDGSHPTLLYGYGGFNVSMTPDFAASVMVWLEHGGVYAVPNLRGGGEYGEAWHRDGMGAKKQNVFDDFLSAAEFLVAEGYTRPELLAIRGGSNGGLLVGAAMTQRPDLFRAVICAVPLLDMVRYHRFGSGETWVPEYGSADDPAQFRTLLHYSPYHRVRKGVSYPALLMAAADSDDRVDPMHARKFVAAVQWASASNRPALLRVEAHAGHGGADLVKKTVESYTDQWAFLLWQLGMD
ncbi:MAG: S9 family peptidase [Deltaproteobacteria bacterium]|nr:S9 family peptidase [Deltaproteobacteria bacterium]